MFHQAHLISVNRREPEQQVDLFPVGGGIAQHAERIQRGNGFLCLGRVVHALRLVDDYDGPGVADKTHGGFAGKPVLSLIDDVLSLFESVDVDDHDLDVGAGRELAYIGQSGAVVNEVAAGNVVVEQAEMVPGDLQGLVHTLADSHGRHNNDELGEAETLVQLKDGLSVDVGFPGPCLHFHAELFAFQIVRHGQGVAFLHSPHVGEHGGAVNEQGVADAVLVFQQGRTVALDDGESGGLLFLADEQIGHGIDGGCLEGLFDELEFHDRSTHSLNSAIKFTSSTLTVSTRYFSIVRSCHKSLMISCGS